MRSVGEAAKRLPRMSWAAAGNWRRLPVEHRLQREAERRSQATRCGVLIVGMRRQLLVQALSACGGGN